MQNTFPKKRNRTMWNSSGSSSKRYSKTQRKSLINVADAESLFDESAMEEDPSVADMEGLCKFCDQLELDPLEDIRVLVLFWKLGSKEKPAQISKEEWMSGCHKLQVDSLEKFKALLPSLDTGFLDRTDFRDFYKVSQQSVSKKVVFPLSLSL